LIWVALYACSNIFQKPIIIYALPIVMDKIIMRDETHSC
jgi:hypothetical protein